MPSRSDDIDDDQLAVFLLTLGALWYYLNSTGQSVSVPSFNFSWPSWLTNMNNPSAQTGMVATNVSAEGIAFIQAHEGFSPNYTNDVGHTSIGYGHDITQGENFATPMTQQAATELLQQDLVGVADSINSLVKVALNQNQFDALADFVYNVGSGAFAKSTLLSLLNQGSYNGAANQFGRWIYAGGVVNRGLENRRVDERNLFLTGNYNVQ